MTELKKITQEELTFKLAMNHVATSLLMNGTDQDGNELEPEHYSMLANFEVTHSVNFENIDFTGLDFSIFTLFGIQFKNCNLSGVDLRYRDMQYTEFIDCDLTGTDFRYAEFNRTEFVNCKMKDADLSHSWLEMVWCHDDSLKDCKKSKWFETTSTSYSWPIMITVYPDRVDVGVNSYYFCYDPYGFVTSLKCAIPDPLPDDYKKIAEKDLIAIKENNDQIFKLRAELAEDFKFKYIPNGDL